MNFDRAFVTSGRLRKDEGTRQGWRSVHYRGARDNQQSTIADANFLVLFLAIQSLLHLSDGN